MAGPTPATFPPTSDLLDQPTFHPTSNLSMTSDSEHFKKPDNTELVGELVWESDEALRAGGFSDVYAGSWRSPDGLSSTSVAIKVLHPPSKLANREPDVLSNALAAVS